MATKSSKPKISPKFASRLLEACEASPHCPRLHQGRQVWLKQKLAEQKINVSVESVRKWLAGDGRPREEKSTALATILGVDPTWLYVGKRAASTEGSGPTRVVRSAEIDLPIRLRSDLNVTVCGLPHDLSPSEAQRIANIILAHAVVQ